MAQALTIATPSVCEITLSRTFDAPRTLLFACWTKPELLTRWLLGPDGWSFEVCTIDLRVGGAYRFVWSRADGEQLEISGTYQQIVPPERLVTVERWGGGWDATINTLLLVEEGALTLVTQHIRYPSQAARDAAITTGMAEGFATTLDRLAAFVVAR